ncbi:MAG: alpha/beta hydrolase [Rhizomicrobium sp.]
MTDPGLAAIRKHLAETNLNVALPELRQWFDALSSSFPTPGDVTVEPVRIAGRDCEIYSTPNAAADNLVIYFHGGGFALGSLRGYRHFASELGRAAGARVLAVDYRLAPEHLYPAGIEDGVAAYRFALKQGISPDRIAIMGDSAGASIALGSILAAHAADLPAPACAVCISPWIDLTVTGASMTSKASEDPFVTREGAIASAQMYLNGADPRTSFAGPLHADLSFLPAMLIQVGSAETLLDDAVRLAGVAGAAGVEVRLEIWSGMIHIWPFFYPTVKAGRKAIAQVGSFARAAMAGTLAE